MTVKFIQLTARYCPPGTSDKVYLAVDKIVAVGEPAVEGAGSNVELVDVADRFFRESVSEVMDAIHND